MKLRPVLLLTPPIGPYQELVVAYISSVVPSSPLPTGIILDPNQPAFVHTHLKVISVLRLHKLATVHTKSLRRLLGSIPSEIQDAVQEKLRFVFNLSDCTGFR